MLLSYYSTIWKKGWINQSLSSSFSNRKGARQKSIRKVKVQSIRTEILRPVTQVELYTECNANVPHGAVHREDSTTIKVVFDGSSGSSLNDLLRSGPKI